MNHPFRPTHANLGHRNVLGLDFQFLGNIVKLDWDLNRHFGHRISRHRDPQTHRQHQRQQLQSKIVQNAASDEIFHGSVVRSRIDS